MLRRLNQDEFLCSSNFVSVESFTVIQIVFIYMMNDDVDRIHFVVVIEDKTYGNKLIHVN